MIDSISFWLPLGIAPDLSNRQASGEGFRGSLGNMRVTQRPEGIYCTGSIARYFQGNNILPLTRRSLEDALRKLEKDSGWDLKQAELRQVEVGTTLPVKKAPSQYLESWGPLARFKKTTHQGNELETVIYRTGERSFTGYDKAKEAESTGQEIPFILSGAELIRLELKYKKGLKKRFDRVLNPWDLADRAIYSELVNRWQAFYFRIPKGKIPVIDTTGGISPKDLDKALKLWGLEAMGKDKYLGAVAVLEREGKLGRVQAMRARGLVKEAAKETRVSMPDTLTAELDSLVRQTACMAR